MNYEQMSNNTLHLRGVIDSEPAFSHEVMGEGFYEVNLKVKRLSEQYDVLPITISERLLAEGGAEVGREISVFGQFRSYNKTEDEKSRLMLTVFVREVAAADEKLNPNVITLTGFLCKPPVYRTTPFNREIADMLIAVNRSYNKSDYIPCIAWGRNARFVKNMSVGEKITVSGRIQSREYQKTVDGAPVTKTAYEVSVNKIFLNDRGEGDGQFFAERRPEERSFGEESFENRSFRESHFEGQGQKEDVASGSFGERRFEEQSATEGNVGEQCLEQ
ncbi:MAG: single-stranded DNA-binding protein [Clostridiales bacterium]|jgi:single-stranded DNA-binding protein|nr:single-stranded DNA-binding protein [Clostridiales bacterium]